jgi:AcrR family transcriptional regulator
MSRSSPRPAPQRTYTREDICNAALALVDEEGLDALSMRRLGSRLGIEAMSLYHHVRDKADLLDALHAAVLGKLEPEGVAGDDWRPLLGGLARALRSCLLRHPNVVPLFTHARVRAPEAVTTLERVRAAMERAAFAPDDIHTAMYVVGMFTIGHVLFETRNRDKPGRETTFSFGLEALLDGVARHDPRPPESPTSKRTRT